MRFLRIDLCRGEEGGSIDVRLDLQEADMQSSRFNELPGNALLAERQMLFRNIREKAGHGVAQAEPQLRFRFLTISRKQGSLGDEIACELAARLAWHLFDREIVDHIARNSHIHQSLVQQLDEKSQSLLHDTVRRILTMAEGHSFGVEDYRSALFKTLAYLAAGGDAVLVGRGANFALQGEDGGLHIRVVASPELCAERLSRQMQVTTAEARRLVHEADRERHHFVRTHFHQDIEDSRFYHLLFNTDSLTIPDVVEAILAIIRLPAIKS
jgi:cytidylate kinase